MPLFGNLFGGGSGGGSSTPLDLAGVPIDRQIAAKMAWQMSADAQFDGITCTQVADTKRVLKLMVEGDVLIDCIGVGMRSSVLNRRQFRRDYVTHAAVRCKLTNAAVTNDILNTLGAISQATQTFFETLKRMELDAGAACTLSKAEPFVHAARDQLYGDGVFLCPIEFTWIYHSG